MDTAVHILDATSISRQWGKHYCFKQFPGDFENGRGRLCCGRGHLIRSKIWTSSCTETVAWRNDFQKPTALLHIPCAWKGGPHPFPKTLAGTVFLVDWIRGGLRTMLASTWFILMFLLRSVDLRSVVFTEYIANVHFSIIQFETAFY